MFPDIITLFYFYRNRKATDSGRTQHEFCMFINNLEYYFFAKAEDCDIIKLDFNRV